jgi:poly(ribitol-phosphate) beta-N-acetylglucosaminyltransferase
VNPVPDVSVIVAVYNTMPYLTTCLTSLVEQSIGPDRMEIIAVDDGSTDGSGKELDRFAELHPGTVRVLHQPNSGGPAGPSNRALDVATGRYVYFVGADDHLGPEALERLVAAADEYGSDVVAGKMVGTNGRRIAQALYATTDTDVDLFTSALPEVLNNCKLFRRELIERLGVRYPEDMPVGSDQPFTFEACLHARRISVLADYTYYYAVRRESADNITYRADHLDRLDCAEKLIEFKAARIEPGPKRDAVLRAHFGGELAGLFQPDFLDLDRDVQEQVYSRISRLADRYFTHAMRDSLEVRKRIRICLAQRGAVDTLHAVIRDEAAGIVPPIVVDGDRAYSRHPGFRAGEPALPDDTYRITTDVTKRIANGVATSSIGRDRDADGGPALTVNARAALVGPSALDPAVVRIVVVPVEGRAVPGPRRRRENQPVSEPEAQVITLKASQDGAGTDIRARIPLDTLVRAWISGRRRLSVRLDVDIAGTTYEIPIAVGGVLSRSRHWHRGRPYLVSPIADKNGRLMIAIAPIGLTRVVKQRLRRLTARSGGTSS